MLGDDVVPVVLDNGCLTAPFGTAFFVQILDKSIDLAALAVKEDG